MLYAEQLSKSFGGLNVLREVSFTIGDGERVGLVGPNGAGKTTILRLVAGEDESDKGEAGCRGGTVGYLRQEAGLDPGRRLLDELWDAFPDARVIDNRLEEIAVRMERGEGDLDALITDQGDLFDSFDQLDGYRIDARIGRVLDGLGFVPKDRNRPCGDFSGGWQMRIALAKVLVRRPDHLLLDEPTNHLDAATRDWLAKDLASYRGTMLIAIHDGELLDRVATRILELRDGQIKSYAGNYSEYQIQKAARLQQQDRAAARQEREVERQSRFIDRFGAKASKASVVKSRKKALDRIKPIERTRKEAEVHFQLTSHGRTEHDVLAMTHVSHTYGDHMVLVDVNLQVKRAQKIVFVGPNGGGKTTLLRIAAGLIRPTDGSVQWGEQARLGYYDQHQDEALDSERTVLEEVRSIAQDEPDLKLRSVLGQFLFSGDDVFKTIGLLSGGERSRVALAKLVVQATNVLLLDEPTNHLDRSTRRKLIQVLEKYEGTILCAAHDRGILERVATRVYDVRNGGCEELLDFRRD